jgi:hypothetical protein
MVLRDNERREDESVLKLQGGKLRELIGRANFDKAAAQRAPKASSEVAGVMRMVLGFEWRDFRSGGQFLPGKARGIDFPSCGYSVTPACPKSYRKRWLARTAIQVPRRPTPT